LHNLAHHIVPEIRVDLVKVPRQELVRLKLICVLVEELILLELLTAPENYSDLFRGLYHR
jgi:hypothetical protein